MYTYIFKIINKKFINKQFFNEYICFLNLVLILYYFGIFFKPRYTILKNILIKAIFSNLIVLCK